MQKPTGGAAGTESTGCSFSSTATGSAADISGEMDEGMSRGAPSDGNMEGEVVAGATEGRMTGVDDSTCSEVKSGFSVVLLILISLSILL